MADYECASCSKGVMGSEGVWLPGNVLLFGCLLCCSFECAVEFASGDGIASSHRPGAPAFQPERLREDGVTWEKWNPAKSFWEIKNA